MKFSLGFAGFIALLVLSVMVHGAKITWDKNGKPIIEKSDKPVKGCRYDPFADKNTTKCEEK